MKRNPYKFYAYWWVILMIIGFGVSMFALNLAVLWNLLIALNAASFLLLGMDKFQAAQGGMRIPEKILFASAFVGGSAGTLVGMYLFRHKTKKTSFQMVIALILLLQIAALAYLYNWSAS